MTPEVGRVGEEPPGRRQCRRGQGRRRQHMYLATAALPGGAIGAGRAGVGADSVSQVPPPGLNRLFRCVCWLSARFRSEVSEKHAETGELHREPSALRVGTMPIHPDTRTVPPDFANRVRPEWRAASG